MITKLEKLGLMGLIVDPRPNELPPPALSLCNNIQCVDGAIEVSPGWEQELDVNHEISFVLPLVYEGMPYWVLAGNSSIFAFDNADLTEILTGLSTPVFWDGDTINGAAVLTNGINPPLYWFPNLPSGTPPKTLPGFGIGDPFEGATALVIASFKRHLVLANIDEGGGLEPYTLWWSNPADPNSVPGDWNYASATSDAGRAYLPETGGEIIAMKTLRDQLIVYRQRATHSMSYVGGQFIFNIRTLFSRVGLYAPRAVAEINGQHLIVSQGDIYLHDGVNLRSVGEDKIKRTFFRLVTGDPAAVLHIHIVPNFDKQEAWICFPLEGQNYCSRAVVWRWSDDVWTLRDLPTTRHASYGVYASPTTGGVVDDSWDTGVNETWDTGRNVPWDYRLLSPSRHSILAAGNNGEMHWLDTGESHAGTGFTATAERVGLNLSDDETVTSIRHVYPRLTSDSPVNFWFGSQAQTSAPVKWEGPFSYDPAIQYRINCRVSGRRHAWRFEVPSTSSLRLDSLDFDHVKVGER